MPDRITPELLLHAYANGVFPMAETRESAEIHWFDPPMRGVLPIRGFHISRSLARRLRSRCYQTTVNRAFTDVVAGCADREETWINAEITQLYTILHKAGFAHSLEVWDGDILAGGVYGVALGGAFFGESMFSRRRDASKVALAYLTHRLNTGGFTLFDTQFITDHLATLGATEIPRAAYHAKLRDALEKSATFNIYHTPPPPQVLIDAARSQESSPT